MKSFIKSVILRRKLLLFLLFVSFLPTFIVTANEPLPAVSFGESMLESISTWIGQISMNILGFFSIVLTASATIFDNLLAIGLHPGFFSDTFVYTAWASLRNIANAIFILIFIYLAFSIMLNLNSRWKDILVKTIIVALFLNFSLFGSRLIVDFGNLTARVFYNSIGKAYDRDLDSGTKHFRLAEIVYGTDTDGLRSVSAPFNNFVSPQNVFSVKSYEAWNNKYPTGNIVHFLFTVAIVGVYIVLLAMTLFRAGFFFLSRMVWLIFYIIVSPVALVSMLIPGISYWKSWLSGICQKSFCVTIYLFFIWLSLIILGSNFAGAIDTVGKEAEGGTDYNLILISFIFKAIIVFVVLDRATTYGSKWCGDEGQRMMKGVLGGLSVTARGAGKVAGYFPLKFLRNKSGEMGDNILRGRGFIGSRVDKMKDGGFVSRSVARGLTRGGSTLMDAKIGGKSWAKDMQAKEKLQQEFMKSMDDDRKEKYLKEMSGETARKEEADKYKIKKDTKEGKLDKKEEQKNMENYLRYHKKWQDGKTLNENIDAELARQATQSGIRIESSKGQAWALKQQVNMKDAAMGLANHEGNKKIAEEILIEKGLLRNMTPARKARRIEAYAKNNEADLSMERMKREAKVMDARYTKTKDKIDRIREKGNVWQQIKGGVMSATDSGQFERRFSPTQQKDLEEVKDKAAKNVLEQARDAQRIELDMAERKSNVNKISNNISNKDPNNILADDISSIDKNMALLAKTEVNEAQAEKRMERWKDDSEGLKDAILARDGFEKSNNFGKKERDLLVMHQKAQDAGNFTEMKAIETKLNLGDGELQKYKDLMSGLGNALQKVQGRSQKIVAESGRLIDAEKNIRVSAAKRKAEISMDDIDAAKAAVFRGDPGKTTADATAAGADTTGGSGG